MDHSWGRSVLNRADGLNKARMLATRPVEMRRICSVGDGERPGRSLEKRENA